MVVGMEGSGLSFGQRMGTMYKSVCSMSIVAKSPVGRHASFGNRFEDFCLPQ
jgi:hypothetical protein